MKNIDKNSDVFSEGKFQTLHTFRGGERLFLDVDQDWDIEFNKPYWIRVIEEDVCLDVYLHLKSGKKFMISGQDALIDGRRDLPYFYRTKWIHKIPCSFMTFNDPSLYVSSKFGAGYFCQSGSWMLLKRVIDKISSFLYIEQANMVFYGASAGGYWALTMATEYPKAKFIVDIPQINLNSYFEKNKKEFSSVFGISDEVLPSVFDFWKNKIFPENIIYLQNSKDFFHIRTQYSFFLERISEVARINSLSINNLSFIFYENNESSRGHSPLSEVKTINLLNKVILDGGENYRVFEK